MPRIPFGRRNGEMVGAHRVKNGRACDCVCPSCDGPLIARQGPVRPAHFAHDRHTPSCTSGHETSLHEKAKDILKNAVGRTLVMPECSVKESACCGEFSAEVSKCVCESMRTTIDNAAIEYLSEDSRYRADVRLQLVQEYAGQHSPTDVWVEIAVCNKKTEKERNYLRERKQACLEIDLSEFLGIFESEIATTETIEADLTAAVLGQDSEPRYITWIYHPEEDRMRELAQEEAQLKAEAKARAAQNVRPGRGGDSRRPAGAGRGTRSGPPVSRDNKRVYHQVLDAMVEALKSADAIVLPGLGPEDGGGLRAKRDTRGISWPISAVRLDENPPKGAQTDHIYIDSAGVELLILVNEISSIPATDVKKVGDWGRPVILIEVKDIQPTRSVIDPDSIARRLTNEITGKKWVRKP